MISMNGHPYPSDAQDLVMVPPSPHRKILVDFRDCVLASQVFSLLL